MANWTLATCSTIELKDNTVIVVLGASGDLAKKKTVRRACRCHPPNPPQSPQWEDLTGRLTNLYSSLHSLASYVTRQTWIIPTLSIN